MARCGCRSAGTCACCAQAGANITIEGTGADPNCWTISAADPPPSRGFLQVTDTDTIDQTLSGTGTEPDQYNLLADVRVDPSDNNILTSTADGLLVDCVAVQQCAESPGEFGVETQCGFEGDGSVAAPLGLQQLFDYEEAFQNNAGPFNGNGGVSPWVPLTVTNPSTCAPARLIVRPKCSFNVSQSSGFVEVYLESQVNAAGSFNTLAWRLNGTNLDSAGSAVGRTRDPVIQPGDTVTVRARCHGGSTGTGNFSNVSIMLDGLLFTLPWQA